MIEEIQEQIDEIKDLIYTEDITKKVIINKLRNIKRTITNYFSGQKFTVKDMRTRQELLQLISQLTGVINSTEKELLKMEFFDKDKIIDTILNLEEKLTETLIQIHVIGEARPIILDIKKELDKKLKSETVRVPNDIEKYGSATINLYKTLKLIPVKEYNIKELQELTGISEDELKQAIENLVKEGYIEKYYKGNDLVVKWTQ